jgi:hypothetical protein
LKKILFNGCSFMAGDEIVWANYSKEVGNELPWDWFTNPKTPQLSDEDVASWREYHNVYKRKHNLPHLVTELLGISTDNKIDLSNEGKSNDMISLATVNYLLSIPTEQRPDYHVVIGWTSVARAMKFSKKFKCFTNLNVRHLGPGATVSAADHQDYIKAVLINADNDDHIINYLKNVLFLENFLRANSISYTFYRAMGAAQECIMQTKTLESGNLDDALRIVDSSDSNYWIKFIPNDPTPFAGESWDSVVLATTGMSARISFVNKHPSLIAAKNLAAIIANKITEDKRLN